MVHVKAQDINVELLDSPNAISIIRTSELFNFNLFAETMPISGFIQISILDNNQSLVALAKSKLLSFNTPITNSRQMFSNNYRDNFDLLFSETRFNNFLDFNFIFPYGKYYYCVEVVNMEFGSLDKDCSSIEIINSSALYLVHPFDEESISESYPLFTWTPVFVPGISVTYNLRWVESEVDNFVDYDFNSSSTFSFINNLSRNIFQYNSSLPEFDRTKKYYWKVSAYSDKHLVAESDIWEFDFQTVMKSLSLPNEFLIISAGISEKIYEFTGDNLNFKLANRYSSDMLDYSVLDENGIIVYSTDDSNLGLLSSGDNYFTLNVGNQLQMDKVYTLVIDNRISKFSVKIRKL